MLEPYYEFRLEVPGETIGRAMTDIQKMQGTFGTPQLEGDVSVLTGTAPVAEMRDYQNKVVSYTRGQGRLFCNLKGYAPCRNQEAVVERIGYDSERDMENPTGSVFCAHGAGFVVPWDTVEEYMHLESQAVASDVWKDESEEKPGRKISSGDSRTFSSGSGYSGTYEDEKELQAIFERTFGPVKRERNAFQKE